jgi:hypothetical protein
MESPPFVLRAIAALILSILCSAAFASTHAPTIFYRVSNDAVNTDRFPSPEDAGREAIRRMQLRGFDFVFHHIELNPGPWWHIYYTRTANLGDLGP